MNGRYLAKLKREWIEVSIEVIEERICGYRELQGKGSEGERIGEESDGRYIVRRGLVDGEMRGTSKRQHEAPKGRRGWS